MGLISKNAILIVEFANQAQMEGSQTGGHQSGLNEPPAAGAHDHGRYRFWSLPSGVGEGAGAEARNSIGFILVIGMMIGTLFTLVLLPAIYALLASDHPRETAGSEDDTASSTLSPPSLAACRT